MYSVSALYNTIIAKDEHWFQTKVEINSVAYGEDSLMSVRAAYRVFGDEQPVVGGCLSAELEVKMLTPDALIPRMAEVKPYIRVTDGTDTSEWIPQGVFYIDTREESHNDNGLSTIKLHCYDAMLRSEADYPSTDHDWPEEGVPDWEVVDEIASTMGVSVDSRTYALMNKAYPIGLPAGYSMREVLGNIAAMYAGNWIMNFDGELRLVTLTELPDETNYLVDSLYEPITFGEEQTEHEVTGAIVSFEGDGSIAQSVVAEINPVQDLNGYSAPWPPGGGKNILPDNNHIYKLNDAGITVTLTDTTLAGYAARKVEVTGTAASWGWRLYVSGIRSIVQPSTTYRITFLANAAYTFISTISTTSSQSKLSNNINYTRTDLGNGLYQYSATFTTYDSSNSGWDATNQVLMIYVSPNTLSPASFTIVEGICLTDSSTEGYYPYSNICPINGYSEVEFYNDPKHGGTIMWNQMLPDGNFAANSFSSAASGWGRVDSTASASGNVATVTASATGGRIVHNFNNGGTVPIDGHKYYVTADVKATSSTVKLQVVKSNGSTSVINVFHSGSGQWERLSAVITYSAGTYDNMWFFLRDTATSGWTTFYAKNAMCLDLTVMFGAGNEPTTVADVQAIFTKDYYATQTNPTETLASAVNGDPYSHASVSLGSTYYKGTLNVTTGVLTATHGVKTFNELNWSYNSTYAFFVASLAQASTPAYDTPVSFFASSAYKYAGQNRSNSAMANAENGTIWRRTDNANATPVVWNKVYIKDTTYTDATAFKAARKDEVILYPLDTPQTVQLTPTEIQTLLGQNNMWADSGNITVDYTYGDEVVRILV